MLFLYGYDTLKKGLKTYFAKYSFKNTELQDFVNELAKGAKTVGAVKDEQEMIDWSDIWLKTAGCADIQLEHKTGDDGKLSSVQVR